MSDVVLHLYYTALDGATRCKGFIQAYNADEPADDGGQGVQRAQ